MYLIQGVPRIKYGNSLLISYISPPLKGGVQKKICNIVTTYVYRQTGNYTKFIYF